MKAFVLAFCYGVTAVVLICLGLTSCSEDERVLLPSAASVITAASLNHHTMDSIMFNILANRWVLLFEDSSKAVLDVTVHPGYEQPRAVNPYGTSIRMSRGYEVLTALTFHNSNDILLLEGHQSGDFPYSYFFKLLPSLGNYPGLDFDLLYYINAPSELKGVFYNRSGVAMSFTGSN